MAQDMLQIPRGTIRGTCLIETLLGVVEMEEIIYELREHSSGAPQEMRGGGEHRVHTGTTHHLVGCS